MWFHCFVRIVTKRWIVILFFSFPLVSVYMSLSLNILYRCKSINFFLLGQEDTAEFLRDHAVNIVASLPCYTAKNVNMQRGKGVFDRSIQALRKFNSLGYGEESSGLLLDLVYNPLGNRRLLVYLYKYSIYM